MIKPIRAFVTLGPHVAATVDDMRSPSPLSRALRLAAVLVLAAPLTAACAADSDPATADSTTAAVDPAEVSTSEPSAEPQPTDTSAPSAEPEPTPTPGQACEPGSDPNCTDDTGTPGDSYRYVDGYAECLANLGADEAGGLCTDLDGDNVAGYPDAG